MMRCAEVYRKFVATRELLINLKHGFHAKCTDETIVPETIQELEEEDIYQVYSLEFYSDRCNYNQSGSQYLVVCAPF